jgi:hypothetical protein
MQWQAIRQRRVPFFFVYLLASKRPPLEAGLDTVFSTCLLSPNFGKTGKKERPFHDTCACHAIHSAPEYYKLSLGGIDVRDKSGAAAQDTTSALHGYGASGTVPRSPNFAFGRWAPPRIFSTVTTSKKSSFP